MPRPKSNLAKATKAIGPVRNQAQSRNQESEKSSWSEKYRSEVCPQESGQAPLVRSRHFLHRGQLLLGSLPHRFKDLVRRSNSLRMVHRVFAFGTLKRSFPLHEQGLCGARFLGIYRTQQRYPMLIARPWFAPMMFNEPGVGLQVMGELYVVDDVALANLDRLDSIGKPGNLRVVIEVESLDGGLSCSAMSYMKARELAEPAHSYYLNAYVDRRFVPFGQRS